MTDLEKLLNNNVKGGLVNRSPKIVDNLISTPGTRFPRAVLFRQESRTPAPINFVLKFRYNPFCLQTEAPW
ncbi:hypothetical protein GCM10009597_15190 [Peribacillus frigoritolerans]